MLLPKKKPNLILSLSTQRQDDGGCPQVLQGAVTRVCICETQALQTGSSSWLTLYRQTIHTCGKICLIFISDKLEQMLECGMSYRDTVVPDHNRKRSLRTDDNHHFLCSSDRGVEQVSRHKRKRCIERRDNDDSVFTALTFMCGDRIGVLELIEL